MQLSAEITMYPLQADYRPLIEAFIARLNAVADGLRIETYPTCTLITGEHDRVMDTLKDLLRSEGELAAWASPHAVALPLAGTVAEGTSRT